MDAYTLSRAGSRAEFVSSRESGFMMTMASGAAADLAECAAALVGLVRGMGGDGLPWWCLYVEDGIGFRCLGCWDSAFDSAGVRHTDACPAMRADAAIRRLAGEGVTDGD